MTAWLNDCGQAIAWLNKKKFSVSMTSGSVLLTLRQLEVKHFGQQKREFE